MKTKELIRRLQEADPSGEIECCVSNRDIWYVDRMPSYYDGRLQLLIRDPEKSGKCYDIIGGKYTSKGDKIKIVSRSIADCLDDDNFTIDYSELGNEDYKKSYKESDDKTRQVHRNIRRECEWALFKNWFKKKAEQITGDPVNFYDIEDWFDKNIDPKAPLQEGIYEGSYNDRRCREWDKSIKITFLGMDWNIEKIK